MHLFQDAEFWVGIALLIFLAIMVWLKVPGMVARKMRRAIPTQNSAS